MENVALVLQPCSCRCRGIGAWLGVFSLVHLWEHSIFASLINLSMKLALMSYDIPLDSSSSVFTFKYHELAGRVAFLS